MQVGSIVTIPAGTRINTGNGQIKATRDFNITVQEIQTTRAGNTKVIWRGHRATKSAVLK
jgi:hypothetical protein